MRHRIKVTFIANLYTFWHSFSSVVKELSRRDNFEPVVLIVDYASSQAQAVSYIKHPFEKLQKEGFPLRREGQYNINREKPDLAFFVSPYTVTRMAKYVPAILDLHYTKSAIIPYCTEFMGGKSFRELYFPPCRYFWRVFTASSLGADAYRKVLHAPNDFALVSGNPEYDLATEGETPRMRKIRNLAGGRKIVLWTPHYSSEPPFGWSSWHTLGEGIAALLQSRREELFVVLRPHQLLGLRLMQDENGLGAKLRNAENFFMDMATPGIESVLVADAVISDLSSMLTKAVALRKSVLFISVPGAEDAGLAQPFMDEYMHHAESIKETERFLDMLASGDDPLLPVPEDERLKFCGPVDGKAGVRIADMLEVLM